MRKFMIILMLACVCYALNAEGIFTDDSFFTRDKIDHFFTGMMIGTSSYLAADFLTDNQSQAMIFSVSVTGVFSLGKEIYDGVSGTGEVSYKDLIYDFLGLGTGILLARLK